MINGLTYDFLFFLPGIVLFCWILFSTLFGLVYQQSKKHYDTILVVIKLSILILLGLSLLSILIVSSFLEAKTLGKVSLVFKGGFIFDVVGFFSQFVIFLGFAGILASSIWYFTYKKINYFEIVILSFIVVLGSTFLVIANDLLIVYLAVELISIPSYILVAVKRADLHSTEAGLKYFILGAIASCLLAFGLALMYASTATFNLISIGNYVGQLNKVPILYFIGVFFIMVSLLFKLAAFPFHYWIGDVYAGAPLPIVLLLATVPKYALGIIVPRFLLYSCYTIKVEIGIWLVFLGLLSIGVGGFLAYTQMNIKKLMAYGSVVHSGFILVAAGSQSVSGLAALLIYNTIYFITTLGFFTFLLCSFTEPHKRNITNIFDFSNFSERFPLQAGLLTIVIFTYVGIPPLLGFFSKLYIFMEILPNFGLGFLLLIALASLIGPAYYLRIVKFMYFSEKKMEHEFIKSFPLETKNGTFVFSIIIILLITLFMNMPGIFAFFSKIAQSINFILLADIYEADRIIEIINEAVEMFRNFSKK